MKPLSEELTKEMIELVVTIKEQSKDNPKLVKTILGKSITDQAKRIHKKLHK